jgi:GNAT superfamily N-acetyltransferase
LNPEVVISDTSRMSSAALADAINAVFAGYYIPPANTASSFASFCRWFNLDLATSVRMETKDGTLMGLAMLGIRGSRGWCGPFGIVPNFRGRGLAGTLASGLIARARSHGLRSLGLEVLVQNERAIKTYQNAGFVTLRSVCVLDGSPENSFFKSDGGESYDIQEITVAEAWLIAEQLRTGRPPPTWQREPVSLLSMEMKAAVALLNGREQGVLVYRHNTIANQVAIGALDFREESVARALLARVASLSSRFFCLNEPENSTLHELLGRVGLREVHRQYEMTLQLG